MDDRSFVVAQIERLRSLGDQYRRSQLEAERAKSAFVENLSGFENARQIAVSNLHVDRFWGESCWELPLSLKGADEIWLSLEQRMEWWHDALTSSSYWKDRFGRGHCLGALGNVYSDLDDQENARSCYEERLSIAIELNDGPAIARTQLNLANCYLRLKQLEQARCRLLEACSTAKKLGLIREEARALGSLAVTSFRRGRIRLAVRFLNKRLGLLQQLGDSVQLASTHANLGQYLTSLGQFHTAESHLRLALSIQVQSGNVAREAMTLAAIAQLYEEQDRFNEAIEVLQKAVLLADDHQLKSLASDCRDEIQRITHRMNGEA